MARPSPRVKLPIPTDEEIAGAITEGLQISAMAPRIEGLHLFIKMASMSAHHSIVFALAHRIHDGGRFGVAEVA